LALPAEGVANPVDEIEETLGILPHQIAAAHPGVAPLEYVAQDLPVAGAGVGVTLEAGIAARDPADRLAHFAARDGNAESIRPAHRRLGGVVELHEDGGEAVGQERGNAADGADFALHIVKREIA